MVRRNTMELKNYKKTTGEKGPSVGKTEVKQKSLEEDIALSGNQRKSHLYIQQTVYLSNSSLHAGYLLTEIIFDYKYCLKGLLSSEVT